MPDEILTAWWRSRRWYVVALAALLLMDVNLSVYLIQREIATETNPLMTPLMLGPYGWTIIIVLKLIVLLSMTYIFYIAHSVMHKTTDLRKWKTAYWGEIAMWYWSMGLMSLTLGNNLTILVLG